MTLHSYLHEKLRYYSGKTIIKMNHERSWCIYLFFEFVQCMLFVPIALDLNLYVKMIIYYSFMMFRITYLYFSSKDRPSHEAAPFNVPPPRNPMYVHL